MSWQFLYLIIYTLYYIIATTEMFSLYRIETEADLFLKDDSLVHSLPSLLIL